MEVGSYYCKVIRDRSRTFREILSGGLNNHADWRVDHHIKPPKFEAMSVIMSNYKQRGRHRAVAVRVVVLGTHTEAE